MFLRVEVKTTARRKYAHASYALLYMKTTSTTTKQGGGEEGNRKPMCFGNDKTRAERKKLALQNANKIKGHKSIIIGFPRIISTASTQQSTYSTR